MNIVAMLVVAGTFSFIPAIIIIGVYKGAVNIIGIVLFIFAALCFILAAGLGIAP